MSDVTVDLEHGPRLPAEVSSAVIAQRILPVAERTCTGCGERIVYDGEREAFVHPAGAAHRQRCEDCLRTFDLHPRARFCPWCGSDRLSIDHEAWPDRDLSEALDQLNYGRKRARGRE